MNSPVVASKEISVLAPQIGSVQLSGDKANVGRRIQTSIVFFNEDIHEGPGISIVPVYCLKTLQQHRSCRQAQIPCPSVPSNPPLPDDTNTLVVCPS